MSYKDAGAFIPTTQIWEVSRLKEANVNSAEFKDLIIRLYENVNQIAINLNSKDTGIYDTQEFVTGASYYSASDLSSQTNATPIRRQVYRKVITFGVLPNTATKSVAHEITVNDDVTFVRIYGVAKNPGTSFLPLPYSSATLADNIALNVDATNVNIITGSDRTAYTFCDIVLEWIVS